MNDKTPPSSSQDRVYPATEESKKKSGWFRSWLFGSGGDDNNGGTTTPGTATSAGAAGAGLLADPRPSSTRRIDGRVTSSSNTSRSRIIPTINNLHMPSESTTAITAMNGGTTTAAGSIATQQQRRATQQDAFTGGSGTFSIGKSPRRFDRSDIGTSNSYTSSWQQRQSSSSNATERASNVARGGAAAGGGEDGNQSGSRALTDARNNQQQLISTPRTEPPRSKRPRRTPYRNNNSGLWSTSRLTVNRGGPNSIVSRKRGRDEDAAWERVRFQPESLQLMDLTIPAHGGASSSAQRHSVSAQRRRGGARRCDADGNPISIRTRVRITAGSDPGDSEEGGVSRKSSAIARNGVAEGDSDEENQRPSKRSKHHVQFVDEVQQPQRRQPAAPMQGQQLVGISGRTSRSTSGSPSITASPSTSSTEMIGNLPVVQVPRYSMNTILQRGLRNSRVDDGYHENGRREGDETNTSVSGCAVPPGFQLESVDSYRSYLPTQPRRPYDCDVVDAATVERDVPPKKAEEAKPTIRFTTEEEDEKAMSESQKTKEDDVGWECKKCKKTDNSSADVKCVGCGENRATGNWGELFKKAKTFDWKCKFCFSRNDLKTLKCVSCDGNHAWICPFCKEGNIDASAKKCSSCEKKRRGFDWKCESCNIGNEKDTRKCFSCGANHAWICEDCRTGNRDADLPECKSCKKAKNEFIPGSKDSSANDAARNASSATTSAATAAPAATNVGAIAANGFVFGASTTSSNNDPASSTGPNFAFGAPPTLSKAPEPSGSTNAPTTGSTGFSQDSAPGNAIASGFVFKAPDLLSGAIGSSAAQATASGSVGAVAGEQSKVGASSVAAAAPASATGDSKPGFSGSVTFGFRAPAPSAPAPTGSATTGSTTSLKTEGAASANPPVTFGGFAQSTNNATPGPAFKFDTKQTESSTSHGTATFTPATLGGSAKTNKDGTNGAQAPPRGWLSSPTAEALTPPAPSSFHGGSAPSLSTGRPADDDSNRKKRRSDAGGSNDVKPNSSGFATASSGTGASSFGQPAQSSKLSATAASFQPAGSASTGTAIAPAIANSSSDNAASLFQVGTSASSSQADKAASSNTFVFGAAPTATTLGSSTARQGSFSASSSAPAHTGQAPFAFGNQPTAPAPSNAFGNNTVAPFGGNAPGPSGGTGFSFGATAGASNAVPTQQFGAPPAPSNLPFGGGSSQQQPAVPSFGGPSALPQPSGFGQSNASSGAFGSNTGGAAPFGATNTGFGQGAAQTTSSFSSGSTGFGAGSTFGGPSQPPAAQQPVAPSFGFSGPPPPGGGMSGGAFGQQAPPAGGGFGGGGGGASFSMGQPPQAARGRRIIRAKRPGQGRRA